VNEVLTPVPADTAITKEKLERRAEAYRQVLSLILSTRSPSRYLVQPDGPAALAELTDRYLPLMAEAGIISERLARQAQETEVEVLRRAPERPAAPYVTQKAANSVRMDLLRNLGITNLPALNRLDLTVPSTFDRDVQQAVADVLHQLGDPEYLREKGLSPLIGEADPSDIHYSVVLFEQRPHTNVLRLQADNVNGPFDVNQGSKLELGSTAKVRVLVTYLELVERLYEAHHQKSAEELESILVSDGDDITTWTLQYLAESPTASRQEVLQAAVERTVSGDPSERFYTGGGLHVFQNFKPESNRTMSIREAVRESANLAFVRLMQDVVNYHIARLPGQVYEMLEDPTNQGRRAYLERFALHEGELFLRRYLRTYQAEAPHGRVLEVLGERHELSARRLAWAYRSVFPEGARPAFGQYLRAHAQDAESLDIARIQELYLDTNPDGVSWQDRGYLAGIHPLELWLVSYLYTHPAAGYQEVVTASQDVRKSVYKWLFENSKRTQDPRIRTILEQEAFVEIHERWARLGLVRSRPPTWLSGVVPSVARSLGSSLPTTTLLSSRRTGLAKVLQDAQQVL
jgi:hypothetical protein